MEISGLRCREPKKVVQNLLLRCCYVLHKNYLKDFVIIFSNSVAYFKPEKINEIMDVKRNGMFLPHFIRTLQCLNHLDRICT